MKKIISAVAAIAVAVSGMSLSSVVFAESTAIDIGSLMVKGTTDRYASSVVWTEDDSFMTKLDDKQEIDGTDYDVYTFNNQYMERSFYGVEWTADEDGCLSLYAKISAESGYDGLGVYDLTDEHVCYSAYPGEADWTEYFTLVEEDHSYVIGYAKDNSVNNYDDSIWIANMSFDNDYSATDEISTAQELVDFATKYNAGEVDYFPMVKLTADINMTGVDWTPIDDFSGCFDGQGYTISNLTLPYQDNSGLFGEDLSMATIKNLNFDGVTIADGTGIHIYSVGALAGYAGDYVTISNCNADNVSFALSDSDNCVGGLIGIIVYDNVITNCTVTNAEITAGYYAGGIVGYAEDHNVLNGCGFSGTITAVYKVGGIVGFYDEGNAFTNCFTEGTITGYTCVGGLAGGNDCCGDSTFTNCYTSCNVTGLDYYVGGLVGYPGYYYHHIDTFTNCVFEGTVTANSATNSGMLFGYADDATLANGVYISDASTFTANGEVATNYIGTDAVAIDETSVITVCDITSDETLTALNTYATANGLKNWIVSGDKVVFAKYYTVTFNDKDGNLIETMENVLEGTDLTDSAPDAPDAPGYEFTGWDADITNVTTDMVVTAVYSEVEDSSEESTNESTDVSSDESNDSTSSDEPSSADDSASSADDSTSSGTNPTTGATVGLSLVAIALAGVGLVIKKRK